ncbi:TPA: hypothetical protein ACSPOR_004664 [Bacillus cereus]
MTPVYDLALTFNIVMMDGNPIHMLKAGEDLKAMDLVPGEY